MQWIVKELFVTLADTLEQGVRVTMARESFSKSTVRRAGQERSQLFFAPYSATKGQR